MFTLFIHESELEGRTLNIWHIPHEMQQERTSFKQKASIIVYRDLL